MDLSSRPHEVSDDLESFFWVLLYDVVPYRNTFDAFDEEVKKETQTVFDQHTKPPALLGEVQFAIVATDRLSFTR
jgi:hypothetical protein